MNIVDRYPHKRLTADYFKRHIQWSRLLSFNTRIERDQPMAYMELGSPNSARYMPGREYKYITLKFDATGLEPREIEAMLFSEYDDIEFIDPDTNRKLILTNPNVINQNISISCDHGRTMGRDYSNIFEIEMIVSNIIMEGTPCI